jgi:hypothetical protein
VPDLSSVRVLIGAGQFLVFSVVGLVCMFHGSVVPKKEKE